MIERIVTGLFYPAVLGGIIYKLLTEILGPGAFAQKIPAVLVSLAVVAHYATDWVATAVLGDGEPYNRRAAMCDLGIIVSLFVAGNCIYPASPLHGLFPHWVFGAMAVTKLCTIFWDKVRRIKPLHPKCEWLLFALYFVSAFLAYFFVTPHLGREAFNEVSRPLFLWSLFLILGDATWYAYLLCSRRKQKK